MLNVNNRFLTKYDYNCDYILNIIANSAADNRFITKCDCDCDLNTYNKYIPNSITNCIVKYDRGIFKNVANRVVINLTM